jgi:cell division protein FtsI/penicillin-binding protein 2
LEGEQPVRYLVKGSPRLCAAALSAREGSTVVQGRAEPLRQLHSALVPALHTFVNPLAQLTDAASAPAGNAMRMRGHDLRIGYHAELTFEPAVQAVAQAVAGCLSGTAPCAGLRSATDLDVLRALYEESAIVRRIGVAMVNARGEILAMASAHTPCWEREMRGFAASETCPRAELAGDRNTWQAGTNHAEQEGGVASMAKLALLGALVESGQVGRAHALQDVIRHAATSAPNEWFEGLATCAGSRTRGAADCDMAQRYIRVARGLGWQTGSFDILFGRPLSPGTDLPGGARPAFLVRALVKQANGSLVAMAPEREGAVLAPYRLFASARQMVQAGHLAPSRLAAWVGSHGVDYEAYVRTRDLALNAIGHGDSRGSPVGIAWTMANLAAMARGQSGIRYPHLVLRAVDAQGRTVEPRRFGVEPTVLQPVLSPAKARQLLEILGYVASGRHGGTAAHAYTQVYGTACAGACVVGKTGTLANEPVKGIALLSSYRGEPVGIAVTVERGLLKGARDSANRAALGAFVLTRTMQEVLQASH